MSSYTYKFLCLTFLLSLAVSASAIMKKKEKVKYVPLYQGVQIGLNLSPLQALYSDNWSASIKADVNLRNKYLPTLEAGITNFNKTNDAGIHFTSLGKWITAGVNLPISISGKRAEDLFFVGAHYGFSAFSYNLKNLSYISNYWGTTSPVTSLTNEKAMAGWLEVVAGVRIQISGPVSLGWTVQYKTTMHVSNGKNSVPGYIPGYGLNVDPRPSLALHVYYRLPF
jgi:hypothetical protein